MLSYEGWFFLLMEVVAHLSANDLVFCLTSEYNILLHVQSLRQTCCLENLDTLLISSF